MDALKGLPHTSVREPRARIEFIYLIPSMPSKVEKRLELNNVVMLLLVIVIIILYVADIVHVDVIYKDTMCPINNA